MTNAQSWVFFDPTLQFSSALQSLLVHFGLLFCFSGLQLHVSGTLSTPFITRRVGYQHFSV